MALQDDVNTLTAEVQARYPTVNTAFVGDPNTANPGTYPEVVNAPTGAIYYQPVTKVFWRTDADGLYTVIGGGGGDLSSVILEDVDRYLDPVGGNDANDGLTPGTAIATWEEMIARTPPLCKGVRWHFAEGDLKLRDNQGLSLPQPVLTNLIEGGLTIFGADPAHPTQPTVTVTGYGASNRTLQVSDALVPGALVGYYIEDAVTFAAFNFIFRRFIVANDATSITLAHNSTDLGGFYDYPLATWPIKAVGTRIIPPDTNSNFAVNRPVYQGYVEFDGIDFDGNNGTGGFGGLTAQEYNSGYCAMTVCKIRNWTQGLNLGPSEVIGCWFESCDYGLFATEGFVTGANYWKDMNNCMIPGTGSYTFGAGDMPFLDNINRYLFGRVTSVIDFHAGYVLDGGSAPAYVHYTQAGGRYTKGNVPMTKLAGASDFTRIFQSDAGGTSWDLNDSANAAIGGTTQYVRGDSTVTLADYNAGVGADMLAARRYRDNKNNTFFE